MMKEKNGFLLAAFSTGATSGKSHLQTKEKKLQREFALRKSDFQSKFFFLYKFRVCATMSYAKKLSSLLDLFEHEAVAADGTTPLDGSVIGATPIEGLAFDSREVKENFLFFALPGIHQNGNNFIAAAIDLGASVIIYQGELSKDESAQIAKSIVCRSLENIGNPQKKFPTS